MFGNQFFHDLFRKSVIVFGNMFDSIQVVRVDKQGNKVQTLAVPLEYAPRQKTLARIQSNPDFDKPTSIIVPTMSFEITSITRNTSLQLNKLIKNAHLSTTDKDKLLTQYMSVPYTLGIDLNIYTKNAYDAFQIVEQILPYFAPEWSVSVNLVPDMDFRHDMKIVLNNVTMSDNATTAGFEDKRVIVWTFNFSVNVPFFGPVSKTGVIKRVFANFYLPPSSPDPVSNNDILNTPASLTYELVPGLTANGQPTTNAAESIAYNLIDSDDNWGFAEIWHNWEEGFISYSGEVRDEQAGQELLATQRATTNLLADGTAVQVKVQEIYTAGSSLTIDLNAGEYVILHLQHNITSLSIINWRHDILAKMTLEIHQAGSFNVTNWGSVHWSSIPVITTGAGKIDIFVLHTASGGDYVFGSVVGQDYS